MEGALPRLPAGYIRALGPTAPVEVQAGTVLVIASIVPRGRKA